MRSLKRQRGFLDTGGRDDGRGDDKPPRARVASWQKFVPACTLALFALMIGLLGLLVYANYRGAESGVLRFIGIMGLASTACLLLSFLMQARIEPRD